MYPQQPQYPQHQQQHPHPQHGQHPQAQPQPPQGPPPNPRIQEAMQQLDLLAGEQVVYTIQADGFFLGANPIAKMVAAFQAFLVTLTGGYIRIFMVVTNQRLIVLKQTQVWCGCGRVRGVHAIALAGIKEVGSSRETQLCCINTRTLQVQSMTQMFNLVIKKLGDAEIRSFVTNLSAVVVAQTNRASV